MFALKPTKDVKPARRPRNSGLRKSAPSVLIKGRRNQSFTSVPRGEAETETPLPSVTETANRTPEGHDAAPADEADDTIPDNFYQDSYPLTDAQAQLSQHQQKRFRQCENWNSIMRVLINQYLALLYKTNQLKDPPQPPPPRPPCNCEGQRDIGVTCVTFDKLEQISLRVCKCSTAQGQLLEHGFLGCSPIHPTLAVSVGMLDFVTEMHTRVSPNQTAWCETLEFVLQKRGYRLGSGNALRKRFSNTLQWYRMLVASAEDYILEIAQIPLASEPSRSTPTPSSSLYPLQGSAEDTSDGENASTPSGPLPSRHLRNCCPLCFGSDSIPEVVVCVDACFTQKRTRNSISPNSRDPPRFHPRSYFLSEAFITEVEQYTLSQRNSSSALPMPPTSDVIDQREGNLKVPNSVLDDCHQSFTAADDRREKASTQFFAETGLMALLCRHDQPLWLANMKHAGERQHYVLALIKQLFDHLPAHTHVKLLYDIACQLERSFERHGFYPTFRHRISFAVSVFHAYGHQWPCQLIYHPRKRDGFGLSDGEGCERLWHAISLLIAVNRVSGYHQRIFNLDARLRHLSLLFFSSLADWLSRRASHMLELRASAERELKGCQIALETLQSEWAAQVVEQTKPLQRQEKNKAKKAIDQILALDKVVVTLEADRQDLSNGIGARAGSQVQSHAARLKQTIDLLRTTYRQIKSIEDALGETNRKWLTSFRNDAFLNLRANAYALRERILTKVVQYKFEQAQYERSVRRNLNDEKLVKHGQEAAKKRQPTIEALRKKHNGHIETMKKLIADGKAPDGATLPPLIGKDSLYKLDIDDDIWQDMGQLDGDKPPPRWLADENVRVGIRAMLIVQRCKEEEERLQWEWMSLQGWMKREWKTITDALDMFSPDLNTDFPPIHYQLCKRRQSLEELCGIWESSTRLHRSIFPLPICWGPSDFSIQQATLTAFTPSWDGKGASALEEEVEDEEDEFEEVIPEVDLDVLEQADALPSVPTTLQDELLDLEEVWVDTRFGDILGLSPMKSPSKLLTPKKRRWNEVET